MNYKNYIKGGIKISELGFGAWQLGVESGWSSVSEKESEYMINTALDRGINFLILLLIMEMAQAKLDLAKF